MRSLSRTLDGETRSVNIPPHSAKLQRKAYESRREREFYSYYESVLSLADTAPPLCDLNDPESVASHRPRSSIDKALTAFVQLTALRLQARRSMLFFFDSDHAYILAEATRTLSLLDDMEHGIDDSLWLGASKIPRGFSVCEVTADLPANHGSNADDPDSSSIAHIIDDLRGDVRFCDRPYVSGGPRARFYAGVPVTTKHGINIGALCVLDDKPRDGLSPADTRFLSDMATTVMTHLSMVRANTENQRSGDMTTALSAFIEGKSKSNDWLHRTAHHTANGPSHGLPDSQNAHRTHGTRTKPTFRKSRSSTNVADQATTSSTSTRSGSDNSTISRTNSAKPDRYSHSLQTKEPRLSTSDGPSASDGRTSNSELAQQSIDTADFASEPSTVDSSKSLPEDRFTVQVKAVMNRAAGLIREAVDVDGVLFLDATLGSYQDPVSSLQALNETDSALTDTASEVKKAQNAQSSSGDGGTSLPPRGCPILGSAGGADSDEEGGSASSTRISESFLRSLLRRYPDGRVWHFNPDGEASSDDLAGTSLSQESTSESNESDTETPVATPADRRSRKRLRARIKDGRMLQQLFPGVRSFLLVGLWDTRNERWYGASMIWSYSPVRILRASTDLNFVAAFCDVVLAEVARLEAQYVDRSKNDFISSISHELRSPLHGILGSAECLEERENDPVGQELVRSVISCGTTLLDIINQLLQYSRLDNGAQQRHTQLREFGKAMKVSKDAVAEEDTSGVATPEVETMLSYLTEEAIDTACAGFAHQGLTAYHKQATLQSRDHDDAEVRPAIVVDIVDAFDPAWALHVTTGSWKRICMNLVSNSLKYTPRGRIVVSLRKHELAGDDSRLTEVTLSVEDTGIGMSDAFQANNLFRPFRQEDSLAQGTGLGLNLVGKLAKAEGGKVVVKSKKGVGTTVTFKSQLAPATTVDVVSEEVLTPYTGVIYNMLGFARSDENDEAEPQRVAGDRVLADVLSSMCHQLGMKLDAAGDAATGSPTLRLVHESIFALDDPSKGASYKTLLSDPSVVICASRASALALRKEFRQKPSSGGAHQFIWQPVGPRKLANAIAASLSSGEPASTGGILDVETVATFRETGTAAARVIAANKTAPQSLALHTAEVALRSKIDDAEQSSIQQYLEGPAPVVTLPQGASQDGVTDTLCVRRSLSLLLVDDNHVNLRLLTVFAKKAGYPYETARDGQEAVDAYKRATRAPQNDSTDTAAIRQPDVVLMDLNMPVLDGFAATKQIRHFEKESGVQRAKIIALTGLGNKEAQDRSFACGTDLFLTKPVRLKELGAILSKLTIGDKEPVPGKGS
nr:hypothetical protein B0A51_08963 [Rachicladosporium sp. CCFEE 5018]